MFFNDFEEIPREIMPKIQGSVTCLKHFKQNEKSPQIEKISQIEKNSQSEKNSKNEFFEKNS